jgi:hypothetical protein
MRVVRTSDLKVIILVLNRNFCAIGVLSNIWLLIVVALVIRILGFLRQITLHEPRYGCNVRPDRFVTTVIVSLIEDRIDDHIDIVAESWRSWRREAGEVSLS